MAMNRWDLATKKWEPKHHDVLCSKHFEKKMLHRSHPAEHPVWAQIHVHRVTDLEKFAVRISKAEALTPLPVVGPLFISPLSFPLSRALSRCVAFQSFSLCLLELSQQARPHKGACLLLGVLFSQFICVCFIIHKNEKVLFVLIQ